MKKEEYIENPTISKNMKRIRKQNGYTLEELSRCLNKGRTRIGYYEAGVARIPIDFVKKFIDFFDITIEDLNKKIKE